MIVGHEVGGDRTGDLVGGDGPGADYAVQLGDARLGVVRESVALELSPVSELHLASLTEIDEHLPPLSLLTSLPLPRGGGAGYRLQLQYGGIRREDL